MIRKGMLIPSSTLLVLTIALWIVSWVWYTEYYIASKSMKDMWTITQACGRTSVMISRWTPPMEKSDRWYYITTISDMEVRISGFTKSLKELPSFEWDSFSIPYRGSTWNGRKLAFPHWLLVCLFGIYPTVAFIRGPLRRRLRLKRGLCLNCGYNLTGNTSGICPECGTACKPLDDA